MTLKLHSWLTPFASPCLDCEPKARVVTMSQPQFEGSVRSPLTLPKMGLRSPLGLPKIQNAIAGVKTPCIDVFFIPLERS